MKKKQKQGIKKHKLMIFGALSVVAFSAVLVLSFAALSKSIGDVKEAAISRSPEAILASNGLSEKKDIDLSVMYYDQRSDDCVDLYDASQSEALRQRQFEWETCGYHSKDWESGLVDYELDEEHVPVFKSGQLTPNKGLEGTDRWFKQVEGKNASYIGALKLKYESDGAQFSYNNSEFYPVDDAKFSEGDVVNKDGHNHLFTMSFAVPFTVLASGWESFEITADDDTFVFVDDKLVIDLGGVHETMKGQFMITENGEVYAGSGREDLAFTGVNVKKDAQSMVRIFHADRDAHDSALALRFGGMNLAVVNTKLAKEGVNDSMQIAYDPTDPTYEAPLGQSVVMQPDNTRGYMVMATIEGVLIVGFSILVVLALNMLVKRKLQQ